MDDQVIIFDTTLRDGEQAPGASMTIPEKVDIARQLARLGVDVIEAGFPISSPSQREAVERIAEEVEGPVTCALARATESDVDAAGKALASGKNTRIHTFIATSDVHLEAKFSDNRYGRSKKEKRQTIIRLASEAVRQACTYTDDVEFSAEDAGRTDHGFLLDVVLAAVEAGATTVNIPDTTGYCIPTEYHELIKKVREGVDNDDIILSTHCHDDLGLAVANSLAGVQAGARQVECTINGIGERAGNAALEEFVMALDVRKSYYGLATAINTPQLAETSKLVSVYSGFPVQPNKAIVGKNAFSHEAGIHQHGVLKSRQTYEIMRAEDVGQKTEQIRLGRHSGRHGLFSRLEKLGFSVPDEKRDTIYDKFLELADRKKEIFEEDLYRLMRETSQQRGPERHYELAFLDVSVGTDHEPEATVRIRHARSNSATEEVATGDGPVDAIYRAIDHAVDEAHDLVDYTIRSVSEGADAQGEVSVLISYAGANFAGRATHTDVLQASAEAYLDALNRLAAHRADDASVEFVTNGIMQAFNRKQT